MKPRETCLEHNSFSLIEVNKEIQKACCRLGGAKRVFALLVDQQFVDACRVSLVCNELRLAPSGDYRQEQRDRAGRRLQGNDR